jgi:hypothetical protein
MCDQLQLIKSQIINSLMSNIAAGWTKFSWGRYFISYGSCAWQTFACAFITGLYFVEKWYVQVNLGKPIRLEAEPVSRLTASAKWGEVREILATHQGPTTCVAIVTEFWIFSLMFRMELCFYVEFPATCFSEWTYSHGINYKITETFESDLLFS